MFSIKLLDAKHISSEPVRWGVKLMEWYYKLRSVC